MMAATSEDAVVERRQRYLDNLAALYQLDPRLARVVDALPMANVPALEETRDGNVTVRLQADDGKTVYAHSRYQPVTEARTLVEAQCCSPKGPAKDTAKDAAKGAEEGAEDETEVGEEDLDNSCFLIAGLGLGYAVAEIEWRFHRPLLIIAEDDPALLKAALFVTDLTEPMGDGRVILITTLDKSHVHEKLRPIMTALMLGLRFVTPPHVRRFHSRFQTQVSALLRDFVQYSRVQLVSVVRNARITCQNAVFNLSAYLKQPGIEVLAGRGAGYPAIIVSAGPSLARNIDQVGALRERAVVIGVQTVLKTLLARGIEPHLVTSLDYHEISAQFFTNISDFSEMILVAEPKVTWHVLDTFRGRTHVLHSDFVNDLLRESPPQRGRLRAGSTVAHLSFYLAEHLGCDPIILVGQDLSFTEGLYYPAGMPIEDIWRPELGRFQTVEMKQWERIARGRSGLRMVRDIHGRETYTDDQLFTYAEQFQSDFLASEARVIHATEGGMRLEGTEVMTLRAAAEQFCTRPLPAGLFALEPPPLSPTLRADVQRQLEKRLEELQEIRRIAADTIEVLERLVKLVERPDEFNRLVVKVDELHNRMRRNERTYNLVSQVAQHAELRRVQADRAINDERQETPASARRRLRRDQEYVAGFLDGCDFLLRMLPAGLKRVGEQL